MKPRIKICCINSIEEAHLAIRYGASAIGLVSAMPSGPGPISEPLIKEIAKIVPPGIATFLLTCKQTANEVIAQQRYTRVNTIQLVDAFPIEEYSILREALPGIRFVQVIHVMDDDSIIEAQTVAPHVDALLLDSGNPKLAIKELGGTGRVHNWEISRKIRDSVSIPIYLAGGLNPANIRDAIDAVQPFGVDLCSGVRTNGMLDEEKLNMFVTTIS